MLCMVPICNLNEHQRPPHKYSCVIIWILCVFRDKVQLLNIRSENSFCIYGEPKLPTAALLGTSHHLTAPRENKLRLMPLKGKTGLGPLWHSTMLLNYNTPGPRMMGIIVLQNLEGQKFPTPGLGQGSPPTPKDVLAVTGYLAESAKNCSFMWGLILYYATTPLFSGPYSKVSMQRIVAFNRLLSWQFNLSVNWGGQWNTNKTKEGIKPGGLRLIMSGVIFWRSQNHGT